MDELFTVGPTGESVALDSELTIAIAPFFVQEDILAAAAFAGVKLSAAGTANASLALYKAANEIIDAKKPMLNSGGDTQLLSRGSRSWKRVAVGPTINIDNAAFHSRFVWIFDREIWLRAPDIYGIAFMVDDVTLEFQGGSADRAICAAFMSDAVRSGINDYPDVLSILQGAPAIAMPSFCVRSNRALNWIGG